jgi:hypothetical protein
VLPPFADRHLGGAGRHEVGDEPPLSRRVFAGHDDYLLELRVLA